VAFQIHLTPTEQKHSSQQESSNYPWKELLAPANVPNWVLCLVGAFASLAAFQTLKCISRQVDVFTDKERGRLTVELDPLELPMPNKRWYLKITIANAGSTKAFPGLALCLPCINSPAWNCKETSLRFPIALPPVLSPDAQGVVFKVPIHMEGDATQEYLDSVIESVKIGGKRVYVIGSIEYWDVFNTHWSIGFCKKWHGYYSNGFWSFAGWRDHGPEDGGPRDGNAHYKMQQPTTIRRIGRLLLGRDSHALVPYKTQSDTV
jgi:hypothetical protein